LVPLNLSTAKVVNIVNPLPVLSGCLSRCL
jgi:hypothetical protein